MFFYILTSLSVVKYLKMVFVAVLSQKPGRHLCLASSAELHGVWKVFARKFYWVGARAEKALVEDSRAFGGLGTSKEVVNLQSVRLFRGCTREGGPKGTWVPGSSRSKKSVPKPWS